jgi:hypothetical protein
LETALRANSATNPYAAREQLPLVTRAVLVQADATAWRVPVTHAMAVIAKGIGRGIRTRDGHCLYVLLDPDL